VNLQLLYPPGVVFGIREAFLKLLDGLPRALVRYFFHPKTNCLVIVACVHGGHFKLCVATFSTSSLALRTSYFAIEAACSALRRQAQRGLGPTGIIMIKIASTLAANGACLSFLLHSMVSNCAALLCLPTCRTSFLLQCKACRSSIGRLN